MKLEENEAKVQRDKEAVQSKIQKLKQGILRKPEVDDGTEKSRLIYDLKDTIALLEVKVGKMESMVKTKDDKIRLLSQKLERQDITI